MAVRGRRRWYEHTFSIAHTSHFMYKDSRLATPKRFMERYIIM